MAKKKALESYNRSRYNALKHGRYAVVLKEYPCTRTKCPIYDYCEHGKKEGIEFCQLKKEAALSMLRNGLSIEKINMDNLIEAKMFYDINSTREHVMGLPGEESRKWLDIMDKEMNTATKIEKTKRSSGGSNRSIKDTITDAAKVLEKRENDKNKKKSTDTNGRVEKY